MREIDYVRKRAKGYGSAWLTDEDLRLLLSEIERMEDALRGIAWQAGSTPSAEVLQSIKLRAEEALGHGAVEKARKASLPLGHPYVTSHLYAQAGCISCGQPESAHQGKQ